MLRIILFINDNVKDLAGPPPWGHGTVIAARQQLINLYDGETGRNGDIYSDWVTAGSNEEWRWFTTDWHGHPEPAQKFYPGGAIKSGGVVSIVEDTDYVLASLWEQDLKQPLEKHIEALKGVVFQKKLGTLFDKVQRVARLANVMATEIWHFDIECIQFKEFKTTKAN